MNNIKDLNGRPSSSKRGKANVCGFRYNTSIRYDINEDYFDTIDTPEKAYILGYIIGDGYMYSRSNGAGVSFHVSEDDYESLDYIRKSIGYPVSVIQKCKQRKKESHKPTIKLSLSRKKIYLDLIKAGLVNGAHTSKETFVELSTPELTWHMLRGVSDADGCICLYKTKGVSRYSWSLCIGTDFLYGMKEFFIREGLPVDNISVREVDGTGIFSICSKSTIILLRNKMYADDSFGLSRKRNKFFSFDDIVRSHVKA